MKLLLVDDRPAFRDSLALSVGRQADEALSIDMQDAYSACETIEHGDGFDAVLVAVGMPGFDRVARALQGRPELPVIAMAASESAGEARRALSLGAHGYLSRTTSPQDVLSAVKLLLATGQGGPMILVSSRARAVLDGNGPRIGHPAQLTRRQLQILKLMMMGHSNQIIAGTLGLSEKTIKVHITALFRTLNVSNRTQAAAAAQLLALAEDPADQSRAG